MVCYVGCRSKTLKPYNLQGYFVDATDKNRRVQQGLLLLNDRHHRSAEPFEGR